MKNPSAILMSDAHLRETCPECRTDNFMETQARKWEFVGDMQKEYKCPILLAGDLFHHWKPSPWLLGWAFDHLPDGIIAIPGQHDLSAHNLDNISKAGIYVLAAASKIQVLSPDRQLTHIKKGIHYQGFPWGIEINGYEGALKDFRVALVHKLVFQGKPPFPGAENIGGTEKALIKQMPGFDLIVTGDNHQTFVEHSGDTVLVNCGSFTRQKSDQVDHKPCVFLWDAETNEVEQAFIPIDKDVVSREHIDVKEERDERIEAFVERLDEDVEIGISYEENMEAYVAKNNKTISNGVQNKLWGCME